jgi:hypothetical protein
VCVEVEKGGAVEEGAALVCRLGWQEKLFDVLEVCVEACVEVCGKGLGRNTDYLFCCKRQEEDWTRGQCSKAGGSAHQSRRAEVGFPSFQLINS